MRLFGLVLINMLFSSSLMAQPTNVEERAKYLMDQIAIYETLIRSGLDSPDNRYARIVYAEELAELFRANDQLYVNDSLVTRWFGATVAREKNFRDVAKTFSAIATLVHSSEAETFDHFKAVDFLGFLEKTFVDHNMFEFKMWVFGNWINWSETITEKLRSEDRAERAQGLRFVFQNSSNFGFLNQFASTLISPLTNAQKARLAADLVKGQASRLTDYFIPFFLKNIQWRYLSTKYSQLLSQMIFLAAQRPLAAERIMIWLSQNPKIARARVPLVKNFFSDSRNFRLFYNHSGEGLTIIEQMFLISQEYRRRGFVHLVNETNKSWALDLISFVFDNDLRQSREMAQILALKPATQDPRWFEWMNQLKPKYRLQWTRDFIKVNRLFTSTGETALQLQESIFRDAIKHFKKGHPFPLNDFIAKAWVNEQLMGKIKESWGLEIIKTHWVSVNRQFVKHIFFHPSVERHIQIEWLEAILKSPMASNGDLLEDLIDRFGFEKGFLEDLSRADLSEKGMIKIMQDSLAETIIEHRRPRFFPMCREILAL